MSNDPSILPAKIVIGDRMRALYKTGVLCAALAATTALIGCGHISAGPVNDEQTAIAVAIRACNRDAWTAGIDAAKWEWHARLYQRGKPVWRAWIGNDEDKRPVEVNIPAEGAPVVQCAFRGNEGRKLIHLPPI